MGAGRMVVCIILGIDFQRKLACGMNILDTNMEGKDRLGMCMDRLIFTTRTQKAL